jgi:hypothetical protein
MSDNVQLACPKTNGHCHSGMYFGKLVDVYTTPSEHWCVVHHPINQTLTARWRMPRYRSLAWCAEVAAMKTKDRDYDEGWTAANSEA